jgi:hypothetical protein
MTPLLALVAITYHSTWYNISEDVNLDRNLFKK